MKGNDSVDAAFMHDLSRREFLAGSAGVAALSMLGWPQSIGAQPGDGWNQGQLAHLIPTASHERFLIKASFKAPLTGTPRLSLNGTPIEGVQTDTQGRFWRFDAPSLQPATPYELRLADPGGVPLCDAWPLKTFPAPDVAPDRLRILAYTCAGGYDGRRVKKPKRISCPAFMEPSPPAPGLDFPLVMSHTHSQRTQEERRWGDPWNGSNYWPTLQARWTRNS